MMTYNPYLHNRNTNQTTTKQNLLANIEEKAFPSKQAFLPADTKEIVPDGEKIDNYGLLLDKFSYYEEDQKTNKVKFSLYKSSYKSSKDRKLTVRMPKPHFDKKLFTALQKRNRLLLQTSEMFSQEKEFSLEWRLLLGLGQTSVYESSLTLHPLYGIPYIPGNTIKGVIRNAIIQEIFQGEEAKAFQDESFCYFFGSPKESITQSQQGNICFFAAFPVHEPLIEADLINPHYAPYYQDDKGNKPAGDYYNPIPNFFLSISKTKFLLQWACRKEKIIVQGKGYFSGENILEIGEKWLKIALTQYGIGAKTSLGYGIFC